MTEPTSGGTPASESRCPWCSGPVTEEAERCPSCGAALRESATTGDDIPGVTQVDPVLRRQRLLPRPNRLVGWLADVDTEPSPMLDLGPGLAASAGGARDLEAAGQSSVAPPTEEVRREMARLELEAIRAELEARAAEARQAELEARDPGDAASAGDAPGG